MKKQIVNLFHKTFSSIDKGTLSVGQLEKNLLHSSKERRRFDDKMQDRLPVMTKNNSDFKIISPFYDRNKVCKALNCHCPYHKKIKEEAIKKYQIRTRNFFNSTIQSPTKGNQNSEYNGHPRMSHKLPYKNKQNNSTEGHVHQAKFNGNKTNSFNFQFDEFLKQTNLLLLNRKMFGKVNDHTVKSSVGQIFQYIYTHLDKERKEVADYIQNIEKDRDLANFYLERYDDLKQRFKNQRNSKQKNTMSKGSHYQNPSRNNSKSNTRYFDRKPTNVLRKTNKQKTQRFLLMERLIKVVKQGAQLDDDEIEALAQLEIQVFEENCNHLKKKIATFDFEVLQNIKEQIIDKLDKNIKNNSELANQARKIQIINELLKVVAKRITELEQQQYENQYENQKYDRIGSSYSKLSISRKGSCDFQGKKRSSKFNDMTRKMLLLQENNSDNSPKSNQMNDQILDSVSNRQKQADDSNTPRASHNSRFNTTFVNGQDQSNSNLPESLKKNQGKFKLAKYRRLSHDGFFFKHNTSGDESSLFIPKMKIESIEDITYGLDTMAMQFGEKWKKIKQIQRRISVLKMKKYIISEEDCLITAKRKVRMLKNLLKQDVFEGSLKQEIKQYVSLIQQFNLLKNRNWAERKLKNMMNLKGDDIQIVHGQDEDFEEFIKKNIIDIFGGRNKLIYYDIFVAEYQEKQICLQNQLFQFIQKDLKLQNAKSMKLQKKMTKAQSSKVAQQQARKKEEQLIQIGLEDHYQSEFCYQQSINRVLNKIDLQTQQPLKQQKINDILSHFKYIERMRLA